MECVRIGVRDNTGRYSSIFFRLISSVSKRAHLAYCSIVSFNVSVCM